VVPPGDSPAFDGRPRSATTDVDGVRVVVDIGKTPHNPTFGTIVTVTIANRTRRVLEWWADGCGGNARVSATTTSIWRDSAGGLAPDLSRHRDWLRRAIPEGPIGLQIDRHWTRQRRGGGCTQFASRHDIEPGQNARREFTWDGSAAGRLGPPPNGPVSFTARLERLKLEGGDELKPIVVTLDSWIVSGPPEEFMSPFEAIDAALADERFTTWLASRRMEATDKPVVEFDRDLWIWVVGVRFGEMLDPIVHAAYIDPITHEVFAVTEHRVSF
jgi:hypothetical protein